MDVTGPSPDTVRQFFSDKVPFAVRPPVFRQPDTRLVGARLANIFQHQAAYVVYRVGNRRVSVFIFDPDTLRPEGSPMRVGDREVLWHRRRGYNVVIYSSRGTGYMVASDLERKQLVNLIAHSE
jgi:anti-sigma factor RsiW